MHFWQSIAPNNVNAWSILSVKCLKQTLTNFFAECIHSAFCSIPPCPSFPPLAHVKVAWTTLWGGSRLGCMGCQPRKWIYQGWRPLTSQAQAFIFQTLRCNHWGKVDLKKQSLHLHLSPASFAAASNTKWPLVTCWCLSGINLNTGDFPGFHGHVLGLPTIIFYSKTMIT